MEPIGAVSGSLIRVISTGESQVPLCRGWGLWEFLS